MKKYVKIFALMMSLVLVIGVLSACSLMGPKNAKECFEKNLSASTGLESYHMDVDMEMGMNMSFSDPTMAAQFEEVMGVKAFDIPIDVTMNVDVGKETAHADMDMNVSMLGQKMSEKGEMYLDVKEGCSYTKTDSDDGWTKSDLEDGDMFTQLFDEKDLENVDWDKMEFKKTDDGYVVTGPVEAFGDGFITDSTSAYLDDVDVDDFSLDGGDVEFKFNKKCVMTEASIKDLKMTGKSDVGEGMGDMDTTVTLDATFEYSKFNEVDEDDYVIPKKVVKDAEEGDSGFGTEDILGGGGERVEPTTPSEPGNSGNNGGSASGSGTVLNGADAQASPYCFVVGQDIAPGTYKVYRTSKSGSGVLSVSDAETFDTNYNLNMGYGLDTDDPDGTTVVLETGDQIYMTDELILEFR